MKRITFKRYILFFLSILWLGEIVNAQTVFDFTEDVQTYTVPEGITSISIECWGAEGGGVNNYGTPILGGEGGYSYGELAVTPGEVFYVYVGGKGSDAIQLQPAPGGFNGGGIGGFDNSYAEGASAGGGGASDVRTSGNTLTDRIIVAGGGGGTAFEFQVGGDAGGLTGLDGLGNGPGYPGTGGTQIAGGTAYITTRGATDGELGIGGNGSTDQIAYGGGGGGGGYYGGGGGTSTVDHGSGWAGGGGGGSSYIDGVTNGITTDGGRTGDGQIIITEICTALGIDVFPNDTVCSGTLVTLTGTSTNGGTITWDNGISNGIAFEAYTTTTYTATSSSTDDCWAEITVTVGDFTNPTISCVDNQNLQLSEGETVYTVVGTEFDPTSTDDNCGIASVTNDFNDLSTLNGEEFPIGLTTVIWTITDIADNTESCSFDVQVNAFSGIEALRQKGISIYPNPTTGILNFEFSNHHIQKLTVSDITGKRIIEITELKQNETIELSNFISGIYFISIQTDQEILTTKIIKE